MQEQAVSGNQEYRWGKGQAYFILIITSLLYLVNYMDRQVFAVVQEPMRIAPHRLLISRIPSDQSALGKAHQFCAAHDHMIDHTHVHEFERGA